MVQEESKNKALDVNVFRGSGRRFSDHQLVAAKIRCLRGLPWKVIRMKKSYEIKVIYLVR